MKKNHQVLSAFTLIEIMVVVVIIGIIGVGMSQLNFNLTNDKQKLESYTYEIVSNLEQIRNGIFLGKAVSSDTVFPDKWEVTFNTSADTVGASYFIGTTKISYADYSVPEVEGYSIQEIYCSDLDDLIPDTGDPISGDMTITFSPDVYGGISFSDCGNDKKKVFIQLQYKSEEVQSFIEINRVNGLVRSF